MDSIVILLNKDKLKELYSAIENKDDDFDHYHLSNNNYTKEINLASYDVLSLLKFDDETKKLIQQEGE
jgi:hypothetical protein